MANGTISEAEYVITEKNIIRKMSGKEKRNEIHNWCVGPSYICWYSWKGNDECVWNDAGSCSRYEMEKHDIMLAMTWKGNVR